MAINSWHNDYFKVVNSTEGLSVFEYCFILQLSAHLLFFFFTPQKSHGASQYINKSLAKGKGNKKTPNSTLIRYQMGS